MDWLKNLLDEIAKGIIRLIDDLIPAPPQVLDSACDAMGEAGTYMSQLSFAVPWAALGIGIGILLTAVGVSTAIRTARIVASAASGGGGA